MGEGEIKGLTRLMENDEVNINKAVGSAIT